uniref:Uncharacterized protein n=1 Tax=Anguilla anguilla TaxID=7936 RepID=A0A0E9PG72_ANGAN
MRTCVFQMGNIICKASQWPKFPRSAARKQLLLKQDKDRCVCCSL